MSSVERKIYIILLSLDTCAILIGMIAGPFDLSSLSFGASVCAALISFSLILYGLYFWRNSKRKH